MALQLAGSTVDLPTIEASLAAMAAGLVALGYFALTRPHTNPVRLGRVLLVAITLLALCAVIMCSLSLLVQLGWLRDPYTVIRLLIHASTYAATLSTIAVALARRDGPSFHWLKRLLRQQG